MGEALVQTHLSAKREKGWLHCNYLKQVRGTIDEKAGRKLSCMSSEQKGMEANLSQAWGGYVGGFRWRITFASHSMWLPLWKLKYLQWLTNTRTYDALQCSNAAFCETVKGAPFQSVDPCVRYSNLLMLVITEHWYEFPHLLALQSQTWHEWAGLCSLRELFTKFR